MHRKEANNVTNMTKIENFTQLANIHHTHLSTTVQTQAANLLSAIQKGNECTQRTAENQSSKPTLQSLSYPTHIGNVFFVSLNTFVWQAKNLHKCQTCLGTSTL